MVNGYVHIMVYFGAGVIVAWQTDTRNVLQYLSVKNYTIPNSFSFCTINKNEVKGRSRISCVALMCDSMAACVHTALLPVPPAATLIVKK